MPIKKEDLKSIVKVKIYARKTKTQLLKQSLGNTRFVWNKLLEKNIEKYKKEKKFLFFAEMSKEITKMRREYSFLGAGSAVILQQMARKLDFSLKAFLKHRSKGQGFPKFKKKSKYGGILIYPRGFKFRGRKLYLPKIGWVSMKDKMLKKGQWEKVKLTARQVWLKEEETGFFAYILYSREKEPKEKNGVAVGIDVGIKNTLTVSNGDFFSLDTKKIMLLVKKAEKLQGIIDKKKLINKKKGVKRSRRIGELERRRDKLLRKIQNIKTDFYYRAVNRILYSHEYVAVEDLNLSELKEAKKDSKVIRRKVNKYLQHISLSKFFSILEWKAELYDRKLLKVNAKDTSKTCSHCGYVNHKLKLSDRVFKCPACGLKIDRDLNASLNILKRGLEHIAPSLGHSEYMHEMTLVKPVSIRRANYSVVQKM